MALQNKKIKILKQLSINPMWSVQVSYDIISTLFLLMWNSSWVPLGNYTQRPEQRLNNWTKEIMIHQKTITHSNSNCKLNFITKQH